jgi:hypothetical protein
MKTAFDVYETDAGRPLYDADYRWDTDLGWQKQIDSNGFGLPSSRVQTSQGLVQPAGGTA